MPVAALRIVHVNLNCAELARSKRFYEQALGLRAVVHTNPAPQDCSAFGLREPGQWDAWMLTHADAASGGALDLLEWLRPRPLHASAPGPGRLGLRALGFEVPDLAAARTRVGAAGGRAASGQGSAGLAGAEPSPLCGAWDPDGAPLWLQQGHAARLAFVELCVSDLERSLAFYEEVLGLTVRSAKEMAQVSGACLDAQDPLSWTSVALVAPGDPEGFRVALTRWDRPSSHGRAPGEPHRLGLYRMALLVADLESCHAELRGLGVARLTAPTTLDLGPACPAPHCRALFFADPDGACLELIEIPSAPSLATPLRARA
jgi:catechol 2,3-dioxygenase-like lactoylglutathione lyase family enzyme